MSATDQQLRALAFLIAACRPHGCKQWDESGIYANLVKVRDRSLASITIAAIHAAEDRNAATPGVIPSAGPHWRAPKSAPIQRQTEPAHAMCVTCGQPEQVCRSRWSSDHEYLSVERSRGGRTDEEREQMGRIVESIKGEIQPLVIRTDEPAPNSDTPANATAAAGTENDERGVA